MSVSIVKPTAPASVHTVSPPPPIKPDRDGDGDDKAAPVLSTPATHVGAIVDKEA